MGLGIWVLEEEWGGLQWRKRSEGGRVGFVGYVSRRRRRFCDLDKGRDPEVGLDEKIVRQDRYAGV